MHSKQKKKKKMKMASARKPELFVWTVNEAELLLRLTRHHTVARKARYLLQHEHEHVVRHCCCCCCCYETSRGSEVEGRGDGVIAAFTGPVWKNSQNEAKHVRFCKRASCVVSKRRSKTGSKTVSLNVT